MRPHFPTTPFYLAELRVKDWCLAYLYATQSRPEFDRIINGIQKSQLIENIQKMSMITREIKPSFSGTKILCYKVIKVWDDGMYESEHGPDAFYKEIILS